MGANRSRRRFGGTCRLFGQGTLLCFASSTTPGSSHRRLSIISTLPVPLSGVSAWTQTRMWYQNDIAIFAYDFRLKI
jgi:hypothetical protein